MPHPKGGYQLADGTKVPSVTEVLKHLDKPALLSWANRMGLEGKTLSEALRQPAERGTLAHADAMTILSGQSVTRPGMTHADTVVHSQFRDWVTTRRVGAPLFADDRSFIDKEHMIAGTPDFVAPVEGVLTLVDIKTAKGIYAEHLYQAGAYLRLIQRAGVPAERAMVLCLPRDGSRWEDRTVRDPETCWKIALLCRALHDLTAVEVA